MKITALMPARNEDWCIGLTGRAVLDWCDEVVFLDHASTDKTLEIMREIEDENPDRVTIMRDPNPEWREMVHRQAMLEEARKGKPSHIAIIDADEVLQGSLVEYMQERLESLGRGECLRIPWVILWRNLYKYRCDPGSTWSNSLVSCVFTDSPDLHWKNRNDGYCFHHRAPYESRDRIGWTTPLTGGLMHLQHVSWRRLLAKQALYKMQEVLRWPHREPVRKVDERYNKAVNEDGIELSSKKTGLWWRRYWPLTKHLDVDKHPWQMDECQHLWEKHGRERFAGLDLFGVVE